MTIIDTRSPIQKIPLVLLNFLEKNDIKKTTLRKLTEWSVNQKNLSDPELVEGELFCCNGMK
jgi:hypothetical protein